MAPIRRIEGLQVCHSKAMRCSTVQLNQSTTGRGRSNEFGKKEGSPFINHQFFLLLLRTYIANSSEHCNICRRNWQDSLLNSVLYGMLHSMNYAREGGTLAALARRLSPTRRARVPPAGDGGPNNEHAFPSTTRRITTLLTFSLGCCLEGCVILNAASSGALHLPYLLHG